MYHCRKYLDLTSLMFSSIVKYINEFEFILSFPQHKASKHECSCQIQASLYKQEIYQVLWRVSNSATWQLNLDLNFSMLCLEINLVRYSII